MGVNDVREQLEVAKAEVVRLEGQIAKGHTIVARAADLAASTRVSLEDATKALTWTTDVWRRLQEAERALRGAGFVRRQYSGLPFDDSNLNDWVLPDRGVQG